MALAVTGYSLGAGGFPQNDYLALAMTGLASEWGAVEMESFLKAFVLRNRKPQDIEFQAGLLCYCDEGRNSPLVERFKKAGLFDLEKKRAELLLLWDLFRKRTEIII